MELSAALRLVRHQRLMAPSAARWADLGCGSGLFTAALATLGDFPFDTVRRAVHSDRAEYLALACAAVGIDRSVFPSLLALVRDLNYGLPGGNSGDSVLAINHAFSRGREAADQRRYERICR